MSSSAPYDQYLASVSSLSALFFFFFERFYSFIFRDRGKKEERERNINVWLPLMCSYWGPGTYPSHVS